MSQADKILNGLTDEEISAYLMDSGSEPHIVIGSDRVITVPDSLKRIAVQYDHNIETVTFDCPRYWDDLDMSYMAVYINYMRSDGYMDSYPVSDIARSDSSDIMNFTWTISRNVTEVEGPISFLVCIKNTDAEGNETNHWNSELNQEMYISKGMETEEKPEDLYPDIITQLLLRMSTVEQINVTKEVVDQLNASATQAKTDAHMWAEEAYQTQLATEKKAAEVRNSYSNAFKGNVSGEIVRVDDVSPLEHDVDVWVHGKNMFDISKITNTSVATNNNDGSITIAANNYYCRLNQKLCEVCPNLKAGDVVVLSFLSDSANTKYMYFHGLQGTWFAGNYITLTDEILDSYITIYGYADSDPSYGQECVISNIQIEFGMIPTEYEPYIDPTTASVSRYNKNLFPVTLGTYNGVTLSKMGNYYVLNGTATGSGLFITKIGYLPAGIYTISANNPKHNNLGNLFVPIVQLYSPDTLSSVAAIDDKINSTATATIEAGMNYESRIRYQEGITYNNFIIKPQLEFGGTATKYEPYIEKEVVSPSEDGKCNVKSVGSNITVLTDTPGIVVEATYNKDTDKAMGHINEALDYIIELQDSLIGGAI